MKLQYGDLPNIDDAIDLGEVPRGVAESKIRSEDIGWNNEQLRPHYGATIPPHRRALLAVQHYRLQGVLDDVEQGQPFRAEIPGLGTLVFQTDRMNWGTDWAVLNDKGEVLEV